MPPQVLPKSSSSEPELGREVEVVARGEVAVGAGVLEVLEVSSPPSSVPRRSSRSTVAEGGLVDAALVDEGLGADRDHRLDELRRRVVGVEVGVLERVLARLVDDQVGDALGLASVTSVSSFDGGASCDSHARSSSPPRARKATTAMATAARMAPPITSPRLLPPSPPPSATGDGGT